MLSGLTLVGLVRIPGVLFNLGWYPGIKLGPADIVDGDTFVGELWTGDISHALLDRLDSYEGSRGLDDTSGLYARRVVETEFGPAYIYEYNGQVGQIIESGDWNDQNT